MIQKLALFLCPIDWSHRLIQTKKTWHSYSCNFDWSIDEEITIVTPSDCTRPFREGRYFLKSGEGEAVISNIPTRIATKCLKLRTTFVFVPLEAVWSGGVTVAPIDQNSSIKSNYNVLMKPNCEYYFCSHVQISSADVAMSLWSFNWVWSFIARTSFWYREKENMLD